MGQVSNETIAKVNNFLRSLPKDQVSKCALCNETLTHIVKLGEVETGAGPMTISRALAELINLTATVNDKVTPKALDNRVRRTLGVHQPLSRILYVKTV